MSNFDDIFELPAQRKPSFDKAAWGERKQAQRQAVFELADSTAMDVVKDGSKFQAYLDLQSRFHRYTSTNALLILAQMPNATRIKDYDGWNDSGVSIKKHQKGFSILEPGDPYTREDGSRGTSYNVKKVFDISQTTAKPEPAAPAPDERTLLRALIHKPPVAVNTVDALPGNLGALYDHDARTISVRRGMAAPDIFRSVSMELAHAELGAVEGYTRNGAALTAYSVSYLLCRQYGVDARGYDFSRAAEHFKGMDAQTVRAELTRIRDTAADISSRMSRILEPRKANKSRGQER